MSARPIWKHPSDVLYREIDFARVLPTGVTISGNPTYAVSPPGLTATHTAVAGQVATVALQSGVAGSDYVVTCTAVMSNGESYNRAITVKVRTGI